LTRDVMRHFWKQYLADERDAARPYASPLRAEDSKGLPPAHVITAEYDVLRDEGRAYAHKLAEAGVPTTTRHYDDMIHGFVHFAGILETGGLAVDDAATVIRHALGR
jgi:acetyl esterase